MPQTQGNTVKLTRAEKMRIIERNPVKVGDRFDNYAKLCAHFEGMKPLTGKQKVYQKRLFNCYFEYALEKEHSNFICSMG